MVVYDLSSAQASERLKVNPATLSRWRKQNKHLTFQQVGGSYRYNSAEIAKMLEPTPKEK